jgi:hypothetical protein
VASKKNDGDSAVVDENALDNAKLGKNKPSLESSKKEPNLFECQLLPCLVGLLVGGVVVIVVVVVVVDDGWCVDIVGKSKDRKKIRVEEARGITK